MECGECVRFQWCQHKQDVKPGDKPCNSFQRETAIFFDTIYVGDIVAFVSRDNEQVACRQTTLRVPIRECQLCVFHRIGTVSRARKKFEGCGYALYGFPWFDNEPYRFDGSRWKSWQEGGPTPCLS